jgi:hypothetical protein
MQNVVAMIQEGSLATLRGFQAVVAERRQAVGCGEVDGQSKEGEPAGKGKGNGRGKGKGKGKGRGKGLVG